MKKKIIITLVALVTVIALIATAVISNKLYTYALTIDGAAEIIAKSGVLNDGQRTAAEDLISRQQEVDSWLKNDGYELWITSRDELRLHAYMVKTKAQSHKYAFLCHGYTGTGSSMAGYASHFYSMGYNVVLPDARGHGQSEGDYIGMGWPERLDMVDWINYIVSLDATAEIILFGLSMGGATVMMTAGETLPANVKLIIEDCGYSSVWEEFSYQLEKNIPIPRFPFLYTSSMVCKLRAGFGFKEASAVKQLKKNTSIPMLFIHGENDDFVPFAMLNEVYNAASCPKEKYTVPGAGHGAAAYTDPTGYWFTVQSFINRYAPV